MYPRTIIRHSLRDALINKTAAKERVYSNRFIKVRKLPTILIFTDNEEASIFNESPRQLKRSLNMAIECIIAGNYQDLEFDDKIDQFTSQIETILNKDVTLGGVASNLSLVNTDIEIEGEGNVPIAHVVLTYQVEYHSDEVYNHEFDDLNNIHSNINFQNVEIKDEIHFRGE